MKLLGILGIDTVRTHQSASYITEVAWVIADTEKQSILDVRSIRVCPLMLIEDDKGLTAELCRERQPFLLSCVREINRLYKTVKALVVYPSRAEFTARVQDEYRRIGRRGINILGKHDVIGMDRVVPQQVIKRASLHSEQLYKALKAGQPVEEDLIKYISLDANSISYLQLLLLLLSKEVFTALPPHLEVFLSRGGTAPEVFQKESLLQPLEGREKEAVERAWKLYIKKPTPIVPFIRVNREEERREQEQDVKAEGSQKEGKKEKEEPEKGGCQLFK